MVFFSSETVFGHTTTAANAKKTKEKNKKKAYSFKPCLPLKPDLPPWRETKEQSLPAALQTPSEPETPSNPSPKVGSFQSQVRWVEVDH